MLHGKGETRRDLHAPVTGLGPIEDDELEIEVGDGVA
jgi:hypothetical protein